MKADLCALRTTSLVRKRKLLTLTCLGMWSMWMLIACNTCKTIWMAQSTCSYSEACAKTLLAFSSIAMSQTSALCKPIATALSASNCCKCLTGLITILPYCPPPKRIKNGNHLQLRPRLGLRRNESSPLKRLRLLLSQRLFRTTSSARGMDVSVEGLPSLIRTPNDSINLP